MLERNCILVNYEGPCRSETCVPRKILRGLASISQGLESWLYMGNIDAVCDWAHAKDYVSMQWMMLQQDQPEDLFIATSMQYSVRQFIERPAIVFGMSFRWGGMGVHETGYCQKTPRFFRPTEVEALFGDSSQSYSKGC